MKRFEIGFLLMEFGLVALMVMVGYWYVDYRRSQRFLEAEHNFNLVAEEVTPFIRVIIMEYEECTPEEADREKEFFKRNGNFDTIDMLLEEMVRHIEQMEQSCPHRYVERFAACIHKYDRLDGFAWWINMPYGFRPMPEGTAASCMYRFNIERFSKDR